jgi:hypothetical protein
MNLLTVDPLFDSRGNIRYFLGAQVDVTGLCKDCTDLDSLRKLLTKREEGVEEDGSTKDVADSKQGFQHLSEMLSDEEVEVVKRCGGRMNSQQSQEADESHLAHRSRIHVRDLSNEHKPGAPGLGYKRLKPGSIFQNVRTALCRLERRLTRCSTSSFDRTPPFGFCLPRRRCGRQAYCSRHSSAGSEGRLACETSSPRPWSLIAA